MLHWIPLTTDLLAPPGCSKNKVRKSGQITANLWDFDPSAYLEFVAGAYVRMTIQIEDYKGARQAKSRAMPMVVIPPDDLNDYESSLGLTPERANTFFNLLMDYKQQIKDVFIKTYLDVIFDNPTTQEQFKIAPASSSSPKTSLEARCHWWQVMALGWNHHP